MLCLSESFLFEIPEKSSESFLSEVFLPKGFRPKVFDFNVASFKRASLSHCSIRGYRPNVHTSFRVSEHLICIAWYLSVMQVVWEVVKTTQ